MRLRFLAGAGPASYSIDGAKINGVDFSLFVNGSTFVGNGETDSAYIYGACWEDGVLMITLAQPVADYLVNSPSNDWTGTGWIEATDYEPNGRYVKATNPQVIALLDSGQAEYWRDPATGAWTVRMIEAPDQEATE